MRLAIALLFVALSSWGAVYPASTGNSSDVQVAINKMSDGDTVTVPAGNWTWTTGVVLSVNASLIGSGASSCSITDNIPTSLAASSGCLITTANNGYKARISGFTFSIGTNSTPIQDNDYNFQFNGLTRIDHCIFYHLQRMGIQWLVNGLEDHCTNYAFGNFGAHAMNSGGGTGYGEINWAAGDQPGTTNAVYMEDGAHINQAGPGASWVIDAYRGARYVVRNYWISNDVVTGHGTESSQGERGIRWHEVYNCTFTGNIGLPLDSAMEFRSGTGVEWGNTFSNYKRQTVLDNYRQINIFSIWGGADGTNAWDLNDAEGLADSGTATGGGSLTMINTGAAWTTNRWVGYSLHNLSRSKLSMVYSNDNHIAYFLSSQGFGGSDMSFTAGDSYELRLVDHTIDQPGYGQGDLIAGGTSPGPAAWPHEASSPLYSWSNTFVNVPLGEVASGYSCVKLNRDFFNSTKRPGYSPLTYPHPWIGNPIPLGQGPGCTLNFVNTQGATWQ